MGVVDVLYSEPRPDLPVRGGMWRAGRTVDEIRVPVATPRPLGPETSWRYFSPARADVRRGPEEFRRLLHEVDARLEVVWHPVNERWVVWFRDEKGWKMVFPVQYFPSGDYMPLDERTIAKVWDRSGRRWGGGRAYWERIEHEIMRDLVAKQERRRQEARDIAAGQYDFAQIKVAMRGQSSGSKFANHQSGG